MGHMRSVVKIRDEAEDEEDPDDGCDGGSSSELGFKEVAIAALMPGRVQQVFVNVVLATDTEDLELSVTGQNHVQLFGHYIHDEDIVFACDEMEVDCSYDRVPESALDELAVQLQGELDRTASALESSVLSFMDAPRWPAPQASAPPPRPTQPPKYKMTREESISALWRVVCLAL